MTGPITQEVTAARLHHATERTRALHLEAIGHGRHMWILTQMYLALPSILDALDAGSSFHLTLDELAGPPSMFCFRCHVPYSLERRHLDCVGHIGQVPS